MKMKIQEDSFEQSPSSFPNKPISKSQQGSKNNRKYNKITHDLRMKFLDKIFFENKSIKKAAQELNINYSSAKTILNLHRKKQRIQQQAPTLTSASDISSEVDSTKVCGFSSQTLFKKQKLELVITLGGRLMNSNKIDQNSLSSAFNTSSQSSIPSLNFFNKQLPLTVEEQFIQQQITQQQQQQLILKLLQDQQLQDQQRQQLSSINPEIYQVLLEKQKLQDQQSLLLAQLLQQQQQKNTSFGLF